MTLVSGRTATNEGEGTLVSLPRDTPPVSPRRGWSRRAVDIAVSAGALIVLSPFVPLAWLAIKADSRGPMLFRQERVGRDGAPFQILKLRTMTAGNRGPSIAGRTDARVTRMGRFLRPTKLDELPQLWNVLRGEMTLVGPRPEVPDLLVHYSDEQKGILAVKPGLTGAGQLYFTVYQADELDEVDDPTAHHLANQLGSKLARDLAYIGRQSWRTDLALVTYTVLLMLSLRPHRLAAALSRITGI